MPGYQYKGKQSEPKTPGVVRRGEAVVNARAVDKLAPALEKLNSRSAKAVLPVWEEPPAAKRAGRRGEKQRIVEVLKQRPGKWARVKEGLKSSSASAEWKKLGCEAVSRKPEGSALYSVWARWPEGDQ